MRIRVTRLAEDGAFELQVDDNVPGQIREVPIGGTFEVEGTPAGAFLGPGGFRTPFNDVYRALQPWFRGGWAKYPVDTMTGLQRDLGERFQELNAGVYGR